MSCLQSNPWYSDRCFNTRPRAWIVSSDDGERIRARTVYAVSLCVTRPIDEIMPVLPGYVNGLKAQMFNTYALSLPSLWY